MTTHLTTTAVSGENEPRLTSDAIAAAVPQLPWNRGVSPTTLARTSDLRVWFPPVIDQRHEPLCSAAAVTAQAAYHAARGAGVHFVPSVLFNYRTARVLAGRPARRGSTTKDSLAAWSIHGLAEDRLWPLDDARVDIDPPRDCFAAARTHQEVYYGRLDHGDHTPASLLHLIVTCLTWGLPVAVEFGLAASLVRSLRSGVFPLPGADEPIYGGHVVLIVGHHDGLDVGERPESGERLTGAFLIRNSWGTAWGASGYGWLPYAFLDRADTRHAWVVTRTSWTETT